VDPHRRQPHGPSRAGAELGEDRRNIVTNGRSHPGQLVAADPIPERRSTTLTAPLVSQHPSRHAQQPRERLRRNIINATPGDQEHLGDGVIRGLLRRAATRIREHGSRMLPVQLLKLNSRHLVKECPAHLIRITPNVSDTIRFRLDHRATATV